MPVIIKNKAGVILPKLIGVCLDKLSITLDLPKHEQKDFINALSGWKYWGPKNGYKYAQWPHLDEMVPAYADEAGDTKLGIQYGATTKHPNLKFLRCSWNPSRLPAFMVEGTLDEILPGLYSRLLHQGMATRLDVAADYAYLNIDDTLFHLPGVSISERLAKSGHTLRLGNDKFKVYDKRRELKDKQKTPPAWIAALDPALPVGRIEMTLKQYQQTLLNVVSAGNPFAQLQVASYAGLSKGDDAWAHFLDSVRLGGAPYALLKMTNKANRTLYAQRIEAGHAWWWKPHRVWEEVPYRVAELFTPTEWEMAA